MGRRKKDVVMNKQEIFDEILRKMRAQGQQAGDSYGCRYRINGLACAVGCLLTDKEAAFLPNDTAIRFVPTHLIPERLRDHKDFLADCQRAHDRPKSGPTWLKSFEANMKNVAEIYGLEYHE